MTDKEKTKEPTPVPKTIVPPKEDKPQVVFLKNELAQTEARLTSAASQLLHSQDQVDSLNVLREALQEKLKKIS
jgi:hypothetical protein